MNGQKVLVTGAGAGIGRGLTKSLLEMGAEVWAVSRTKANLESLKCYGVPLETGLLGLHAHRYWASIFNLTLYPVKQISSMHLC